MVGLGNERYTLYVKLSLQICRKTQTTTPDVARNGYFMT